LFGLIFLLSALAQFLRYASHCLTTRAASMVANVAAMNEAAFKNSVIDIATRYGWFVHHDLPAMNRRGQWATHVQGNTGFPDLVLLSPKGVLVFAELKTDIGRLSKQQEAWLDRLDLSACIVQVWRPNQMPVIIKFLATA